MKTKRITLKQAWLVRNNEITEGFAFSINDDSIYGYNGITGQFFTPDMKSFAKADYSNQIFYDHLAATKRLKEENESTIDYCNREIKSHQKTIKEITNN